MVNLEILKSIKNMFGLCEHFLYSFVHVQANSALRLYQRHSMGKLRFKLLTEPNVGEREKNDYFGSPL